ncbi:MAG: ATP-dependent RecD-like DNA helicase, partial [Desulfovibrio sp.]|nr:ATP-dependent RecD-like DNA helicase [Desulfovibrio sp.]
WIKNPKYGEQFAFSMYQCMVPATSKGIEKYLGSGLIKGIGPKMAKRIVKVFGEKTLDIIEKETEKLSEVPGIGEQRIEMIKKAWAEQKEIREVMLFLQSHGVSSTYAAKIYKQYGKDSITVVQTNPYRLAYDIFGIGFLTADKIAMNLGFAIDSPLRAQAGLLYTLYECSNDGHVFFPTMALLEKSGELLGVDDKNLFQTALGRLEVEKRIVLCNLPIGCEDVLVSYVASFYWAEVKACEHVLGLLGAKSSLPDMDVPKLISWAEEKTNMTLESMQKEAVAAALTKKILVITGGPGTGKSTLLNVVLRIYRAVTRKISLAAPTGRAAKRMSEVTGVEAKTIHRLLSYDFNQHGFRKNENDPLDCDLLIVDEVSMVDLLLFHHLLKAVPPRARLILVGDTNQLPSVGAGSVLHDLINSGRIPVVRLTHIFRQAQQSCIISNAHRIIQGQSVFFRNKESDDMFFIEEEDSEKVLETIVGIVKTRLPRKYGFNAFSDIQVLSPMNRGSVGTERLNEVLQAALNPTGLQIKRGTRIFRVGDKVMQIKNNYDKEVFNGDIGIIKAIDEEEQVVSVEIDGIMVSYDFVDMDELVLAYAISIHKSQGGEYPVVVIPITTQHFIMLQRNLLYTGVTRGKKMVVLVGTRKALGLAIRNNRQMKRYSGLAYRIQNVNYT